MLENARFTAFTISEIFQENPEGGDGVKKFSPRTHTRRLKTH